MFFALQENSWRPNHLTLMGIFGLDFVCGITWKRKLTGEFVIMDTETETDTNTETGQTVAQTQAQTQTQTQTQT